MCKKIAILSLIIAYSFCTKAQDVRQPPRVVGPSPEASALGQFGSWPVSLYTGIPQIEAPLYTIDYRGFKLPVSLSYHASGIKVEDVASWVGTGWALQAGGVISRTVMGIEDESGNGYYRIPLKNKGLPASGLFDLVNNDAQYKLFTDVSRDLYDTEPDIFNFNFGGISGQFFFDEAGVARTIPASTIKVKHHPLENNLDAALNYWEIVDDKGITYILGKDNAIEQMTMMDDDQMFNKTARTAWYLNKIILPNKQDSITFEYTAKYERYSTKPSQTYRVPIRRATDYGTALLVASGYGYSSQLGEGPYAALSIAEGKVQLSAINWKYGKVNFFSTTFRKDINGKLLDSIRVFDASGRLVKNLQFRYNNNVNRPFLTSIVEKDRKTRDSLEHYKFEYYDGLPSRFSNSQDAWGYYNGKSNLHLIPYEPRLISYNTNAFAMPNADRSCNGDYMKAGTLSKIYYPTKGYTVFDYEANEYYKLGEPGNGSSTPGYYTTRNADMVIMQDGIAHKTVQDIVVKNQLDGEMTSLKIQIRNYYKGPGMEESYLPRVTIAAINADGSLRTVYTLNAFDDWEKAKTRIKYTNDREDLDFDMQVTLLSGNYRVTTELACLNFSGACPSSFEYKTTIHANLTYNVYIPPVEGSTTEYNFSKVGGLRIKQITSYEALDKIASKKMYDYNTVIEKDGALRTVSSGTLIVQPKFYSYTMQNYICGRFTELDCDQTYVPVGCFSSGSLAMLGLTQGGYVGYEQVREREDADGKNGETIYKYSMAENQYEIPVMDNLFNNSDYGWSVYMPNTDNSYKRGLLLEKTVVSKINNVSKTVLKEQYNYNLNDYEGAPNYFSSRYLRIKRMTDSLKACCGFLPTPNAVKNFRNAEFAYSFYSIKSPWVQMTFKKVLQDGAETTTVYEYKNLNSMQPTKETVSTSTGDLIVKSYKYPHDIVNAGQDYKGVFTEMIARNIITPVVEEETVKNAAVSKVKTTYKNWMGNGNLLLPDSILVKYNNTDTYYPVISYNNYDHFGNILSYSDKNVPVNFLWGYNKQYPVAKVTGSTYSKIAAAVSNTLLDNPANEQQLHNEIDKAREDKALVQSYAYLPLEGISSETSAQGKRTYYDYDGFGRLLAIRDQDKKVMKAYAYNYGVSGEQIFYNDQREGTFIRKTCGDGYLGQAVKYVVPQGIYSSAVSLSDANAKADNDVFLNGQLYADINGVCNKIYYNNAKLITLNRNNCSGDGEGSSVVYTVVEKKYSSLVSQAAADNLADDEITQHAQAYANERGTCIYYNSVMSQPFTKVCDAGGIGSQVIYTVAARKYSASTKLAADDQARAEIANQGQSKANAEGACTYYNSARSQVFTPVCSNNFQSRGPVTYTVAANKYSSNISKADAEQKAQKDITDNGQAYANSFGCICVGEGYAIINGRCELGTIVQIESHREGDKWACTYYYRYSNGTRSENYTGLGDQKCQPPIEI